VLHIFSIFDERSSLKGVVFQRLFELCDKNDQLKIIVENLKKIEEISAEWVMSVEERRELYRSCAASLDRNNQQVAAFKVMMAYLKLFQKSTDQELAAFKIEHDAKRCVILGVKVPTVIDFKDILNLNAVKYLNGKDKEVFDFMSLFTSTDSKQFEGKVKSFQRLMDEEKLGIEEVIRKKQYVQICALQLENSNHKYDDLAAILNIHKDDVEQWAIEAIAGGIIDAKIDQISEEIVIKSHIMNQEWRAIKEKLGEWSQRFGLMQAMLQQSK